MNPRNLIILLFIFVGLIFISSCKKKDPVEYPVGNYSPTSKNSYWKYETTSSFDSISIFLTGKAVAKFDKIYYEEAGIWNSDTFNYVFFARTGNHYYQLWKDYTTGIEYEILYLKADAQVGESWESKVPPADVWKYKIIEKLDRKEVNGITYSNVLRTQRTTNGVVDYEFYYAMDVGLIETNSLDPNHPYTSKLIRYTLK